MSTGGPDFAPHGDLLSGWKEIAACLGKSVRAAQRWERDLGLPVHRLKTAGGQVVFARRSEIDAWKASVEVPRDELADEAGAAGSADAGAGVGARVFGWPIAVAVAALAVAVPAVLWVLRTVPAPERPVRFQFVGRELEARDGRGALAWSFGFPDDAGPIPTDRGRPQLQTVLVDDLDGDGGREVVVLVRRGAVSTRALGVETLYVLSEQGDLRWQYAPEVAWTFAGRRFEGPWVVLDLLIAGAPGDKHIWVAYGHNPWWPSFLVRLDRRGDASVRFVQSGLVYGLGYSSNDGRSFVLAAGVNNEYASASVAVLDTAGPPAVSPQSAGSDYRCDDCPGGAPDRYFLLPQTELTRFSTAPYNAAVSVNVTGTSIQVSTKEWDTPGVAAIYRMSASFDPVSVDFSDGVWTVHRALESDGRLAHSAEACPERAGPKVVREWRDGVWGEIEVPVTLALVPGVTR